MNGPDNKGDKSRTDLIPPRALLEVGHAMKIGGRDYGERNWEAGIAWGSLLGAAQRHQLDWLAGDDINPETGLSHLAHAAASLLMLLELVILSRGEDDRKSPEAHISEGTTWLGVDVATSEVLWDRGILVKTEEVRMSPRRLSDWIERMHDLSLAWHVVGLSGLPEIVAREVQLHRAFPADEPIPARLRRRTPQHHDHLHVAR